jgi:response regulator RpfG family c-di-GMP phosphodiesterase
MKNFRIIILDDQRLFRTSIKNLLVKYFPDALIKDFSNNQEALAYIIECTKERKWIDLIITDLNHMKEPDGLEFASRVRQMEKELAIIRTPILLLTMCEKDERITNAISDNIIDMYLTKAVEENEIIDYVSDILD